MRLALSLALAALLAAPATAGRYETDHDADADFSAYDSFAWQETEPTSGEEALTRSDLIVKRMRSAVVRQLRAKGLAEVAEEDASLLVEFHVLSRDRLEFEDDHGYYRSRDVHVRNYSAGTAVIDLVDAGSGELVWRGWARDLVRDGKLKASKIERAVEKLFRDYPPDQD
jgi:hypothetical protein